MMPEFITKNLAVLLSVIVISVGGLLSFNTLQNNVNILESRVNKLEESNTDIRDILARIDKKMSLLICKQQPENCLLEK